MKMENFAADPFRPRLCDFAPDLSSGMWRGEFLERPQMVPKQVKITFCICRQHVDNGGIVVFFFPFALAPQAWGGEMQVGRHGR